MGSTTQTTDQNGNVIYAGNQIQKPQSYGGVNLGTVTGNSDYNGLNIPGYISTYVPTYDPNSAFSQLANRKSASPWALLSQAQQADLATQAKDNAAPQAQQSAAQADDTLSMQGGLSSGARERTATEGAKNYLSMAQNASRTAANNDSQIGINDEQNRLSMLGTDNANQIADKQAQANALAQQNAYNQSVTDQENKAVSSNQQAQATAQSGGNYICTALYKRKLISLRQYVELNRHGVYSVPMRADFIAWYQEHGKKAVDAMDGRSINHYRQLFMEVMEAFEQGDRALAEKRYLWLTDQFFREALGFGVPEHLWKRNLIRSLMAIPGILFNPRVRNYIAVGIGARVKGVFRGRRNRALNS